MIAPDVWRSKVHLTINGKETEIGTGTNLVQLLEQYGIPKSQRGIAVALNDAVVPREAWAETELHIGDAVEIVSASQGG
jgi:sulfur carrier protein